MVGGSHIDIHSLVLDELVGVVNLYPWYGQARLELCRRMSRMGADAWGREQFASEALYLPDRSLLSTLARSTAHPDCSDKDVRALLSSYMETPQEESAQSGHAVHVVGGDYFSQAQYDKVKEGGDGIFSRFAVKISAEDRTPEEGVSPIADRFATETLARIFAEQGRLEEAKRIYSRLILDIPEKSAYFASLIQKLDSENGL